MDLSTIISKFITIFCILVPIAAVLSLLKSPKAKGAIGELKVNLSAKLSLNKKNYHQFNNVTLLAGDGTTQVDHIIVSVFGVFVIETKNMKGWIFGGERQKTWTQKIYKYSNKFQNPLRQNYKHVKVLQKLLGINDYQLHSLVVFVGDSIFKTSMPDNVIERSKFVSYIKSKREKVLTPTQVQDVIEKLNLARLDPSSMTDCAHIDHVDKIVSSKKLQSKASQYRH